MTPELYMLEMARLLLLLSGFGLLLLVGGIVAAIIERVRK